MTLFKMVFLPVIICALIALPSIWILDYFMFFDGKSNLVGGLTGISLGCIGLVAGHYLAHKAI